MAQTNFTPILLYASSTPTNVPTAGNLTNSATGSEIAINIADKNLFFKDSGGVVNTVPIRQSGTSSNGWLSAIDWNTFNNKAPATSGTSILYGNGSGGFSNVTIGTGVSFVGGTLSATGTGGTVTSVTGTAPVVSSGGTTPAISMPAATTSVNGYLTSTDWNTFNNKQPAGTYVTSVGATSPVTSSGGTTPTIAMPAATTSVSGYLTSTDWNTFNNKGSGTVTSVTGTAPVVSSGGATPAISMAAATASVNGYLTSTDWTTFNNKGSGTVTSVAALTLGTTGTDLSSSVATGTTTPVITLNVPTASATNRGALSAADWTTFNNKQPAGTYINSVAGTTNQITASTVTGAVTLSLPTSVTTGQYIANQSTTASAAQGAIAYGTLSYSDTNILASYSSSVAGYNQIILQNTNAAATASTNFNVSNNLGTATTNYGEFGINSSAFTGTGAFNAAGAVYLTSVSTDLAIGTIGANAIHFVVNSGATDAMTISSAGVVSLRTALAATSGGTGQSTYAVGDLLQGAATNTLSKLAAVATGNALISGGVGVASSWGKIGLTTHVSGTLAATSGGTGQSTYAVGDLLIGAATNTLAKLADVATGNALISGGVGVAPSYGKIGLTTHISGTLAVGNGGTGQTSFTAGYVHFGSFSTDANFFWDNTNKRLGLGIATPSSILDVRTNLSATTGVQNIAEFYPVTSGATDSGYGGSIKIYTKNANGNYWPVGISALNSGSGSNLSDLGLYTAAAGATLVERMRIFSTGGVSIGNTTDPGAGGLRVSGLMYPQQATTAGAPAYVKGAMYFDTTLNKLRIGGATAWETVTSV